MMGLVEEYDETFSRWHMAHLDRLREEYNAILKKNHKSDMCFCEYVTQEWYSLLEKKRKKRKGTEG